MFGYIVIRKCLALNDVHGMERMNDDIPFEHQMMFIVKDYDRKVEENMELRKEVEELSAALAAQEAELKKAKKELKKMPSLKDKAMQLEAVRRKNEKLTKQASLLYKCVVYVRNQTRHLLVMVEVPGLRDLEQRMIEALKNMMNSLVISDIMSIFAVK